MNTQKQIGLMIALFFVLTAGCAAYAVVDIPIRATDQTEWHFEESVHRGALLYANNCRTCHGIRGEGFVGPSLNTPDWKNQDPLVLAANRAILERTLYCGRAGTLMPAWLNTNGGSLNVRQIEHLVDLITAPEAGDDEDYEEANKGWEEAVHAAHVINHETAVVVGGDTLAGIARQHDVGISEVLALNSSIVDPLLFLPKGTIVTLPPTAGVGQRAYEVKGNRENIVRIIDSQSIGAMLLADANQVPYEIDDGTFVIGGKDGVSQAGIGLFPGATLTLPDLSYVLRAGDTLESIAATHNVDPADIAALNEEFTTGDDPTAELSAHATLALPDNAVYIVRQGDTQALVEELHGLAEDALAGADLTPGASIPLPAGTRYTVQAEDTLAVVAAEHGISEQDLASINNLAVGAPIRPEVVFELPGDATYAVQGQSLDDIRQTLGGVTAESLGAAQEPAVPADHVYAVGTTLIMPPDSYGSAPPDARNPGTACVEHAVPASVFETIINGPEVTPDPPEEFSSQVEILSHANDWTVVADGATSEPNVGVVKVDVGTTVTYRNVLGFHTVTSNGETLVEEFGPAVDVTFEQTFEEAGEFKITCDIHPAMLAWVFVEEAQ